MSSLNTAKKGSPRACRMVAADSHSWKSWLEHLGASRSSKFYVTQYSLGMYELFLNGKTLGTLPVGTFSSAFRFDDNPRKLESYG